MCSLVKFAHSRLHDTQIVMNKGEIKTGESNENEDVHKFKWVSGFEKLLF
jgi:hypothetical protein